MPKKHHHPLKKLNDTQMLSFVPEEEQLVQDFLEQQQIIEACYRQLHEQILLLEQYQKNLDLIEVDEQRLIKRYAILDTYSQKLNTYYEHIKLLKKELQLNATQHERLQFSKQIDAQADSINALLKAGQEEKAIELLDEHHGMHLYALGLNDLLDLLNGKKTLYDAEGLPTTSFNTDYIVPTERILVKEEGQYHLLLPGQKFNLMSAEEKREAQARYQHEKLEILQQYKLILHNKGIELASLDTRKQASKEEGSSIEDEILKLTYTIHQAQSNQTSITALIKNKAPLSTPKPRFSATQIYEQLSTLAANNPELRKEMTKIKPGMKINPETMKNVLRLLLPSMERIGVNAYNPSITNTPSPLERRLKPR